MRQHVRFSAGTAASHIAGCEIGRPFVLVLVVVLVLDVLGHSGEGKSAVLFGRSDGKTSAEQEHKQDE